MNVALTPMLDVRLIARQLGLPPIDLVREMQADGVELLPVTAKRWRVEESAYLVWKQQRQAQAAERAEQARRRQEHVASKAASPPAKRRARFRR